MEREKARLAEANAKLAEQREATLRALAEADNARKRALTEAANAQKYALERFVETARVPLMTEEAARGLEKRRVAIEYLRQNLHELRPVEIQRPGSATHPALGD